MVKKIPLKKLSHNELTNLCMLVMMAIEAIVPVNTGVIAKLMGLVKEYYQKFVQAVNRSLKGGHAEILKEKDNRRDDAFRAIRDVVLGYSRCLNNIKRESALLLLAIFERNGWTLYIDSYLDESVELNKLIVDLSKKENTDAMKVLVITELFDDLKASQKDFEDAFYNKVSESVREDYAIITKTRPQLISNLSDLLERINSNAKFDDNAEEYKALINTINNIITETATAMKARITRENGDLPVDGQTPVKEQADNSKKE